jgi:hypothetical protein
MSGAGERSANGSEADAPKSVGSGGTRVSRSCLIRDSTSPRMRTLVGSVEAASDACRGMTPAFASEGVQVSLCKYRIRDVEAASNACRQIRPAFASKFVHVSICKQCVGECKTLVRSLKLGGKK